MHQKTLNKLQKIIEFARLNSIKEQSIATSVSTMFAVVYQQTLDEFPEFETEEFQNKFKMIEQRVLEIKTQEDVTNVSNMFSTQIAVNGRSFADTFDTYLNEYLDRWIMLLEKQN